MKTWYRKWQDAEAAGGVTYVKGTGNLPGGKSAYLYISGLKLRETWAETITRFGTVHHRWSVVHSSVFF